MDLKLDPSALARFQQASGGFETTKKTTKTKTNVRSRKKMRNDTITFECHHITTLKTGSLEHTFVFEATGNVTLLSLKQTLSREVNIPVKYLTLTMYDVELTHGTLDECGVPEDVTLFISDEREDVSTQMNKFTSFDETAFEGDELLKSEYAAEKSKRAKQMKAKAKSSPHDLLGGMPDRKPKKKTKTGLSQKVTDQTRPKDIGAVNSQLVAMMQKFSAAKLRQIVEKQGMKPTTWNKKKLIEQLVEAENQKQAARSKAAPAAPQRPLPATTKERMKAYNQAAKGSASESVSKPPSKKEPVKKPAPVKPKPAVKKVKKEEEVGTAPPVDLKYMRAKELRDLLQSMGIKPTTWNKTKLIEAVKEARGGSSEPAPAPPGPVVKVEPPKKAGPPSRPPAVSVDPPNDLVNSTNMMPPPPPTQARNPSNISTGSSVAPPDDLDSFTNMAPPAPPNLQEPPATRSIGYSDASVGAPEGLDDLQLPPDIPSIPESPPQNFSPPPVKKAPPPPKKKSPPPKQKTPPPAVPEPSPAPASKKGGIAGMAAHWDAKQKQANEEQKSNPFSNKFDASAGRKNLPSKEQRGMAAKGTKSYERMKKAQAWAKGKLDQLYVEIPKCPGAQKHSDGSYTCNFASIFEHYAHIDSVITGTLKSAKKKGHVHYDNGRPFPLLQQAYDDDVIVTLFPRE